MEQENLRYNRTQPSWIAPFIINGASNVPSPPCNRQAIAYGAKDGIDRTTISERRSNDEGVAVPRFHSFFKNEIVNDFTKLCEAELEMIDCSASSAR